MSSDEPLEPDAGDDLEQFRAIARRVGTDPVAWEAPPAGLWEQIAAEAGVDSGQAGGSRVEGAVPGVVPITAAAGRRRRGPLLLAAAAAVVVVMGAGLVWSLRPEAPVVVAQVQLERLGDVGDGHAELVERRDGRFELRLETSSLDVGEGSFVEVWMIDADVSGMVSLGPLRDDGRYELPLGLDPAGFPIVDISIEPFDGEPAHSGNSALRGQLTF